MTMVVIWGERSRPPRCCSNITDLAGGRRLMAGSWCHELQRPRDIRLQLFAMHDGIEHSVFKKKFASLKSRRKFLTDRLLDHARAGKSNGRPWFGDVQV